MKYRIVLGLFFLGVANLATIAIAQSLGTFVATGDLTTERSDHASTLLWNGRVLIAGGARVNTNSAGAELYDPSAGTFTATGDMTKPRSNPTATLLPDGKVLIAGGGGGLDLSAELYDPATGTFTATGERTVAFFVTTAVLLPNGKVLIAGNTGLWNGRASAELYEPSTQTFTATGEMFTGGRVIACLLANGKVLISGDRWGIEGIGSSDELYDPATGTFSATADTRRTTFPYMNMSPVSARLLTNGKVLITLYSEDFGSGAEIYDPSTGTFSAAFGNPPNAYYPWNYLRSGTLLPDGAVLLTDRNYAEVYDPVTGTLSGAGPMLTGQASGRVHSLLPDGTVLITGGWVCCGATAKTVSNAEVYRPAVLVLAPVLFSLSGDGRGQGAIQHAATYRIASATEPAVAGEYLAIYGTGLVVGSVIPPQVTIGGRVAEILFFGKAPGFAHMDQVNVRMPGGVVPGPNVPVRLNYLGRPSNQVTIGAR